MNRGLNEKVSEANKVNQLQKNTGRGIIYRRIIDKIYIPNSNLLFYQVFSLFILLMRRYK